MGKKNQIEIFKNADELSRAAADFIVSLSKKKITEKGKFVIALSGGRTPEKLFSLLVQQDYQSQINWQNVFVFWGDERCVASDDERNNANAAKSLLLDKIEIPASNIFVIPVNFSPAQAAEQYEETIRYFFNNKEPQFDLILLGLGDNGHTASLFPLTDVIHEKIHLVKEVYVKEQEMFRVTMTAPLINKADNILFLVTGKEKSEMLNIILNAPYQPGRYPAQLIKPESGTLFWYIDEAAASDI